MAIDYEIADAFRAVGRLWAKEQLDGDDDGITNIETVMAGLRSYKEHEENEGDAGEPLVNYGPATASGAALKRLHQRLVALREGEVPLDNGRTAYYQDAETLRDALDLYAVLAADHATGSPNLENDQALDMVKTLQSGAFLGESQLARLFELLGKYRDPIEALRASPDREGQDFLHVPEGDSARIIDKEPV
jgi:hypothetical protein